MNAFANLVRGGFVDNYMNQNFFTGNKCEPETSSHTMNVKLCNFELCSSHFSFSYYHIKKIPDLCRKIKKI